MDNTYKVFSDNNFIMGRMISGSKSSYRRMYPDNLVVFNANILTEEDGKIWYGDLDLTLDSDKLNKIATELNKKIYVLYEMDARFENEDKDPKELIKKAIWSSK